MQSVKHLSDEYLTELRKEVFFFTVRILSPRDLERDIQKEVDVAPE